MKQIIGVLGAGTMGAGIAQVAAQNGNQVILVDVNQSQLDLAKSNLSLILSKLIEKEKISISFFGKSTNFPLRANLCNF